VSEAVVVSMMRVVLAALSLAMASCQDFGSVQEMMESNVETFCMAGVAGGVFHGLFGWLTRGQAGERIYGSGVPIGKEDMFIMGSAGKSMTSTMAARVVAKGFIQWNTTTKEMFHDTGLIDVHPTFQGSTLESFLSHGSGAPGLGVVVDQYHGMVDYIFNHTSWEPGFDNRPARLFLSQTLLQDPVTVTPGNFEYSIGGFTVAAHMLELATNKTFEQLMTEELYGPLGMEGCGFGPTTTSTEMPPKQPWGHMGDTWGAHVVPLPPSDRANVASAMIPDGGLHCSQESWKNYLLAHLNQPEDFLPADIWEHIHTPVTQGFYGFGWFIDNSQGPEVGTIWQHGGADAHNFAQAFLLPKLKLGLTIAINHGNGISDSRQQAGFEKTLTWMFANMGQKDDREISPVALNTSYLGADVLRPSTV